MVIRNLDNTFAFGQALARRGWRLGRAFGRDRRGSTGIQALVLMPVFVLVIVASSFLWQGLQVRRSLHTGTYLGTRFLALYPLDSTGAFDWAQVARKFVIAELKNNPYVDVTRLNDNNPRVTVELPDGNDCGSKFTVTVEYDYWLLSQRITDRILPNMQQYTFQEKRNAEVLCVQ